jgi:hypothetical protein
MEIMATVKNKSFRHQTGLYFRQHIICKLFEDYKRPFYCRMHQIDARYLEEVITAAGRINRAVIRQLMAPIH